MKHSYLFLMSCFLITSAQEAAAAVNVVTKNVFHTTFGDKKGDIHHNLYTCGAKMNISDKLLGKVVKTQKGLKAEKKKAMQATFEPKTLITFSDVDVVDGQVVCQYKVPRYPDIVPFNIPGLTTVAIPETGCTAVKGTASVSCPAVSGKSTDKQPKVKMIKKATYRVWNRYYIHHTSFQCPQITEMSFDGSVKPYGMIRCAPLPGALASSDSKLKLTEKYNCSRISMEGGKPTTHCTHGTTCSYVSMKENKAKDACVSH